MAGAQRRIRMRAQLGGAAAGEADDGARARRSGQCALLLRCQVCQSGVACHRPAADTGQRPAGDAQHAEHGLRSLIRCRVQCGADTTAKTPELGLFGDRGGTGDGLSRSADLGGNRLSRRISG